MGGNVPRQQRERPQALERHHGQRQPLAAGDLGRGGMGGLKDQADVPVSSVPTIGRPSREKTERSWQSAINSRPSCTLSSSTGSPATTWAKTSMTGSESSSTIITCGGCSGRASMWRSPRCDLRRELCLVRGAAAEVIGAFARSIRVPVTATCAPVCYYADA